MSSAPLYRFVPAGKRQPRVLLEAAGPSGRNTDSSLIFVTDSSTKYRFLVDTGAELSILPRSSVRPRRTTRCDSQLYAANGSTIATFGLQHAVLDLGLRRRFSWDFIVADVQHPILGADFLKHYGLLVDVRSRRLVDSLTQLRTLGKPVTSSVSYQRISAVSPHVAPAYQELLKEFEVITVPRPTSAPLKHDVQHHIVTTPGPPVVSRVRRLNPERFKISRAEFDHLMEMGPSVFKSLVQRPSHGPKERG